MRNAIFLMIPLGQVCSLTVDLLPPRGLMDNPRFLLLLTLELQVVLLRTPMVLQASNLTLHMAAGLPLLVVPVVVDPDPADIGKKDFVKWAMAVDFRIVVPLDLALLVAPLVAALVTVPKS